MQKIIKLLIITLTFFVMTKTCLAYDEGITVLGEIPNVKLHVKTSDFDDDINMSQLKSDRKDEPAYSIDPRLSVISAYYDKHQYYDEVEDNCPITQDEFSHLAYIAFFGYQYENRTTIDYYIATQYLIWQYILPEDAEIYFLDEEGHKADLYQNEIADIEKSLEEKDILPSFAPEDFFNEETHSIKDVITLHDDNNVLKNYDVVSYDAEVSVQDNDVIIKFNKFGYHTISINPKNTANAMYGIYQKSGYSAVINRGFAGLPNGTIHYYIRYPMVTINKEKIPNYKGSYAGIYGLYNSDDYLIKTFNLNDDGTYIIDELSEGEYYLQELKTPLNFKPTSEKLYFNVLNDDLEINLKSELNTKKITISNYLINHENILLPASNIKFAIYDLDNNLISTFSTNEFGNYSFELPYGTYKIKQITNLKGYSKAEEITITIDDLTKENYYQFQNQELTGKLKINFPTKNLKFKILNKDNNTFLKNKFDDTFISQDFEYILENIPYANYELIILDNNTKYDFTINSNAIKELSIENPPELQNDLESKEKDNKIIKEEPKLASNILKINVPKTGVNEFLISFILSTLILSIGIYICNHDKKKP